MDNRKVVVIPQGLCYNVSEMRLNAFIGVRDLCAKALDLPDPNSTEPFPRQKTLDF